MIPGHFFDVRGTQTDTSEFLDLRTLQLGSVLQQQQLAQLRTELQDVKSEHATLLSHATMHIAGERDEHYRAMMRHLEQTHKQVSDNARAAAAANLNNELIKQREMLERTIAERFQEEAARREAQVEEFQRQIKALEIKLQQKVYANKDLEGTLASTKDELKVEAEKVWELRDLVARIRREHAEQLVREKKVGYVDEALLRVSEARAMKLEEDLNLKVAQLTEETGQLEAEKKHAQEAEDELLKTHDQLLHAKEELKYEKTERVKEREAAAALLKRTIDEWTVKLEHERAERAKEKELSHFMVSRQKALTCAPVDEPEGASAHESETESEGWVEEPSAFDDEPDVEIVRLHGLCARPELNGVYGIITGAKRADGRYPVKLYPEDRSVLVRACNLTMVGGYDDDYSYSHDEDSESDDSGDDHPSKSPRHATDPTPPKPPPEPPPAPVAATAPSTAVHPSIDSTHARYMTRRASLLGLLPRKWLGADGRTTWRFCVTPECSCHWDWRAHMMPTSSTADTASNLQTEAAEPERQQLIAIPPLRSIKAPDTLPAKSPLTAIPTSTPPRAVVHPRHTQLADVTDISRRLFSQSPTPSSPLLPPSITDTSADLQLEVATALQHATARPTSTQAQPGTPRRHAKEALRKAASIQAQHKHQCHLAEAERARVAEASAPSHLRGSSPSRLVLQVM